MGTKIFDGKLYITNKNGMTAEIGKASDADRTGRVYRVRYYLNGERMWDLGYKGYRTVDGAKRAVMLQLCK